MTDDSRYPSLVRLRVAGDAVGSFELPDDPADHRGILSWFSQPRDRKLREAGSYGYLCTAILPWETLKKAAAAGVLVIRFEVDPALPGGLALYGERFGRYPLDPTLVFSMKR
jgi:predicted transcriptional regulator